MLNTHYNYCCSLCLFWMFSIHCHELGSSKEAPPKLASQLVGTCPTNGRLCASHPADRLFSRSVPEPNQDGSL